MVENYSEDSIRTLDWREHIRLRPGMYIGKLGDGTSMDDGIYILVKEVVDNSIDEFAMGAGSEIVIKVEERTVSVRDYGRGIPLGKLVDVSSKMNTGAKYDSEAFKKSVGLNGVGIKAVNALSSSFFIQSYRDGMSSSVSYACGETVSESGLIPTDEANGTLVQFAPDETIFKNYAYREELIEPLLKNYVFLNTGLTILLNGRKFHSRNGLVDLLNEYMTTDPLYPIVHLKGTDIEVVITHSNQYGEEYYSFVNGQHTTQGGTHLSAFREAASRTIKEFYNKNFEYTDILRGSTEDFRFMFGLDNPERIYREKVDFYCKSFICTDGPRDVRLFTGNFDKHYPVPQVKTVSTIGAGDNFNAGIVYGLIANRIRRSDINGLSEKDWDEIIACGMAFGSEVCQSVSNSVSLEFAEKFRK